jgi:hypothetical protein
VPVRLAIPFRILEAAHACSGAWTSPDTASEFTAWR